MFKATDDYLCGCNFCLVFNNKQKCFVMTFSGFKNNKSVHVSFECHLHKDSCWRYIVTINDIFSPLSITKDGIISSIASELSIHLLVFRSDLLLR